MTSSYGEAGIGTTCKRKIIRVQVMYNAINGLSHEKDSNHSFY
ncbi:hypothetical protein [Bacteroides acidifaciens]|nr:hypothetical protein [Bacteroides acidifaciens]